MTTLRELALDERLAARVFNAERRLHERGVEAHEEQVGLGEEGLISSGARRRDAIYRRSLIAADVVAAGVALWFAIVYVGNGSFGPGLIAAVPLVIVLGKLLGLYDRDEHVCHKSTLDEAPKHFQLAMTYPLLAWFLQPLLFHGPFTRAAAVALWLTAFCTTLLLRGVARELAR